ncbi:MAG: LysR family transcriptional regulator [Motiliproteus sp.]
MDIHSLNAFVNVAETRSFSIAAEKLFLTQPAVSKRISNLEQQTGCKLFDRIGRKVFLTEAGATLLPKAKHILLELEDTQRMLLNLSGRVSGKLSLAVSHHVSLHRLPDTLRAFSKSHPEVELDLEFTESELAYEGILHGDMELAIITLSPHPHAQIEAIPVWLDNMRFVVANDHPLTRLDSVSFQDLNQHNAILPDQKTFTREIAEQHFSAQGLELNVIMSTNYLDTIRMMVSIGLGWSLLPETVIDASLTVLEVPTPEMTRPLGLIFHRDRTLSNAAKVFIELLTVDNLDH